MAGLRVAMLTGRNSLLMRQEQMNVIGNNVANAGRPEYHRQTAELASNLWTPSPSGPLGTGARIKDIVRRFDLSLEISYREALHQEGHDKVYADRIQQIEQILAPSSESALTLAAADFADAWQNVANRPESIADRVALLHRAENVARELNLERHRLVDLRDSLASSSGTTALNAKVSELNSYAERLTALNRDISSLEGRAFLPQQANDLRDERDEVVAGMARLTDLTVVEENDSTYTVAIAGKNLVQGQSRDTIQLTMAGASPALEWASDGLGVALSNGEIDGLFDAYSYMDSSISDLDTFAAEFANTVNTAHAGGFDLDGTAGAAMFDVSVPGQVAVLITNAREIAAANVAGHTGDGGNARDLWQALNTANPALGDDTLLDHPDRLVNDLARDIDSAASIAESAAVGVEMYQEAIGRHSGVNVEEEMLNMLEVQRAYQASAKLISVVNEMLGDVIGMV